MRTAFDTLVSTATKIPGQTLPMHLNCLGAWIMYMPINLEHLGQSDIKWQISENPPYKKISQTVHFQIEHFLPMKIGDVGQSAVH